MTEQELGIEVVKTEMIITFRQTITLTDKTKTSAAIAHIQGTLATGKVTGRMYANMNQGGTMSVVTEEVSDIPPDTDAYREIDAMILGVKASKKAAPQKVA